MSEQLKDGRLERDRREDERRRRASPTVRDPVVDPVLGVESGPAAVHQSAEPATPVPKPAVKPPPPGSQWSVFQSPIGSGSWIRDNPTRASELLKTDRGVFEADRAKHGRAALSQLVGEALGPLPPSYRSVMVDMPGGDLVGLNLSLGLGSGHVARYAAAARLAAGDRSREALAEFAEQDSLVNAREDGARKAWALDQQWKPGSARRPEWMANLLKLHPELRSVIYAGRQPSPSLPPPPLIPPMIESELVKWLWHNLTPKELHVAETWKQADTGELRARDWRVDLNTAPAAVLGTLPGFGPGLSKAVIEAREQHRLESAEDMDRRVRGIGKRRIDELRPHLRFPGDVNSDPAGADRAYGDVLAGRPPRTIGPVGAMGGYTMRDLVNDVLAKVKPRPWPAADLQELPGISSRETPMRSIDPAEIGYERDVRAAEARGADPAELRRALGDYFKRVTVPAAQALGPRTSAVFGVGRGAVADWHSDANGMMRDLARGPTLADALPTPVPPMPDPIAVPSGRRAGGGWREQSAEGLGDGAVSAMDRLTRSATAAADALELRDRYRPPAALPAAPPSFAGRC